MSVRHLLWDCGTAYDLFVSLRVLHEPSKYGLRGSWARGVRARLSPAEREVLEQATDLVWPFHWVHALPLPKDGKTALQALKRIPAAQRLSALAPSTKAGHEVREILHGVAAQQRWGEEDRRALQQALRRIEPKRRRKEDLARVLEAWSRAEEFGEQYLRALGTYFDAFFAEEEARIQPALERALARAQALAGQLDLPALLEELSQGLRLADLPDAPELVLAPSFWSTPLLVFASVSEERDLILFGARPSDASLVPGEEVPDALMRALKALGDPTRLRILRYLMEEPHSPTRLASRLRLRAPTVIHHLDTLRMAELVHLTLGREDRRLYAARREAVDATCAALGAFLGDAVEGDDLSDTNAAQT
jgi:DNA-binding transcriptional ArsR family regulator